MLVALNYIFPNSHSSFLLIRPSFHVQKFQFIFHLKDSITIIFRQNFYAIFLLHSL